MRFLLHAKNHPFLAGFSKSHLYSGYPPFGRPNHEFESTDLLYYDLVCLNPHCGRTRITNARSVFPQVLLSMKQSMLFISSISLFLLSGCAVLEHPLSSPDECKACPELHGVFSVSPQPQKSEKVEALRIVSAGDKFPPGFLKISVPKQRTTPKEPASNTSFVAFAKQFGDSYVIQIPLPHGFRFQPQGPREHMFEKQLEILGDRWDPEKIRGYFLLRLTKTDSGFRVALLDNGFLKKQIESKNLSGHTGKGKRDPEYAGESLRVTSDTPELQRLFESNSLDTIFAGKTSFRIEPAN